MDKKYEKDHNGVYEKENKEESDVSSSDQPKNTKSMTQDTCYLGKRGKVRQNITTCPHTDRQHFAKGMCRSCYKVHGRQSGMATNCTHTDQ